jgi:hypothetical protein
MKTSVLLCGSLLSWLVTSNASAAPPGGANELRVGQGGTFPGLGLTGLYHFSTEGSGSGSLTILGANAAIGHFVTDNVEIGSGFTLIVAGSSGGGDTLFGPGIAPFVKYTSTPGGTGVFVEGTVLYQALIEKSSISFYGGGLDVGVETFPKDSWSLRIGPSYRMLLSSESGTSVSGSARPLHAIGLSWALSAYF